MHARLAAATAVILLLAGCIAIEPNLEPTDGSPADLTPTTTVFERANLPFVTNATWSSTLVAGAYGILPSLEIFVPVELPIHMLGSGTDGSAVVHMGVWLPDVPEGTRVPVIADIGPYYGETDPAATEPANRLGKFLIENFVPHGYAVAQVSVFGTGQSTHCMDLMGPAEQAGVDAAVSFLGGAEWSNGKVGLIGRSYDGSTPWQAAMFGNPALATIVPISGLIGMHDLMWRNGSAEFRGPIMHNFVYGQYGMEGDASDYQQLCRDYLAGPAQGAGAYATGDHVAPQVNDYWRERSFLDRALANYEGSVYFIHGLQDWNVDPHMAFPTYHRLEAAGIEVKGLFGQWAHHYPDRASEHERLPAGRGKEAYPASVRLDWAQDLLEWFDHYLKGTGAKPALVVEVQDNMGAWRVEETYPPADTTWIEVPMSEMSTDDSMPFLGGPRALGTGANTDRTYVIPPLSEDSDVRIAGLPQLHVTVTPMGPGGQIFAQLRDSVTGLRFGHAIMDLRYAAGGSEMRPVVPGVPITAQMEFVGLDVVLPAGHGLELFLAPTGEDYMPSVTSAPVLIDDSAASVLRLPTVVRGEEVFFMPPGVTS